MTADILAPTDKILAREEFENDLTKSGVVASGTSLSGDDKIWLYLAHIHSDIKAENMLYLSRRNYAISGVVFEGSPDKSVIVEFVKKKVKL